MKSAKLYVFKTEYINFVNLLQFCFYLSRRDLHQPCVPIIKHKFLSLIPGEFCLHYDSVDPLNNFRNIDWTQKIESLNLYLKNASQPVVFGTNNIDQVNFLKNNVECSCITISCSYTEDQYDLVLNYFVKSHLEKQSMNLIEITDLDQKLREDKSLDLFSYYRDSFDRQNLIPKQLQLETDFVVPLIDFFDKTKFFQHLENIGGCYSHEADEYYDSWRNEQSEFFTGTNI